MVTSGDFLFITDWKWRIQRSYWIRGHSSKPAEYTWDTVRFSCNGTSLVRFWLGTIRRDTHWKETLVISIPFRKIFSIVSRTAIAWQPSPGDEYDQCFPRLWKFLDVHTLGHIENFNKTLHPRKLKAWAFFYLDSVPARKSLDSTPAACECWSPSYFRIWSHLNIMCSPIWKMNYSLGWFILK